MNIYAFICLFRGHDLRFIGVLWSLDGTELADYECRRCHHIERRLVPPEEISGDWEKTEEDLPDGRELEYWRRKS
jgi:hypothetical protein